MIKRLGLVHLNKLTPTLVTLIGAIFKPTLPDKSKVDGGATRCQHLFFSCITCATR